MLAIRMQRTGRTGRTSFRVVVQDSRFSPTSGRVVEQIGSYDPHAKTSTLDKEKAEKYLKDGAQPSVRVVKLLKQAKVKMPDWVADIDNKKKHTIKSPEKLRRNRPPEPKAPKVEEAKVEAPVSEPAEEVVAEATETPAEAVDVTSVVTEEADTVVEETTVEETPVAEAEVEVVADEPKEA